MSALRHGSLAGQDLSLLNAGSSVLRGDVQGDLWTYEEHNDRFLFLLSIDIRTAWTERSKPGRVQWTADSRACTYIGERDADGWTHAPEGGWSSNPVPGVLIEWRSNAFTGSGEADAFSWNAGNLMPIKKFRLAHPAPEQVATPSAQADRAEAQDAAVVGLLERLEAQRVSFVKSRATGKNVPAYVNPDGPEAASVIRSLQAERDALRKALGGLVHVSTEVRALLQKEPAVQGPAYRSVGIAFSTTLDRAALAMQGEGS